MKTKLIGTLLVVVPALTFGQFNVLDKVKNKANQRAEQKVDQAIDKGLDKTEEGVKSDGKPNEKADEKAGSSSAAKSNSSSPSSKKEDLVAYGKYDFVPGTKIIFEDDLVDETPGEFPSKWNLAGGKVEVAKVNGENVIAFLEGNYAAIFPLWKDKGDYLPEQFTIEFDHYVKQGGYQNMAINLHSTATGLEFDENNDFRDDMMAGQTGSVGPAQGTYPESEYDGKWHHIGIAYNKGNVKIYNDQYRLCNAPHVNGNPASLYLGCIGDNENTIFIKNIRIAEGGGDLYKRVVSDGKFISRGILFDVNKSTLKPQSMGPINEITAMMKAHPELKFEIDGHTDSDGEDAANLRLSQERADAVKSQLIAGGIDGGRLTTKGFGESKPVDNNNSSEGKANNRRVEFVKM